MKSLQTSSHRSQETFMSAKRLQPTETIRFAEIDGLIVILDLSSEDYFVLNSTGTYVWKLLLGLGGDVAAAMRAATTHYSSGNRPEIMAEVALEIEEWKSRGFLDSHPRAVMQSSERKHHLRSLKHCFELSACWSLATTAFTLRRKGFARTYQSWANLPMPSSREISSKLMSEAEAAFVRMENVFFFRSAPWDCLPRSLAFFHFCRSVGLPVGHRIGGRRFPQFVMHAWVEYDNHVVLDDPDCNREFTLLASIPP